MLSPDLDVVSSGSPISCSSIAREPTGDRLLYLRERSPPLPEPPQNEVAEEEQDRGIKRPFINEDEVDEYELKGFTSELLLPVEDEAAIAGINAAMHFKQIRCVCTGEVRVVSEITWLDFQLIHFFSRIIVTKKLLSKEAIIYTYG